MSTKKLTIVAMLMAVYVVLSILTPVKIMNFKFTFEAFPILVAAFLFGPLAGFAVGGLGSFLYQILFSGYGLTITTILWILPHALSGLLVGFISKKRNYNCNQKEIIVISILSAFLVTGLNLIALYFDSKIFGYYSFALVFGNVVIKIIAGMILAILYSFILPKLIALLKNK